MVGNYSSFPGSSSHALSERNIFSFQVWQLLGSKNLKDTCQRATETWKGGTWKWHRPLWEGKKQRKTSHIPGKHQEKKKKYSRWERCTEFLFLTSSILTQPSISCLILFRACVPWKQVTLQPLPPIQRDKEKRAELLSVLWVIWGLWRESITPLWRLTPGYDPPAQQRCRKARTQVTFECYL